VLNKNRKMIWSDISRENDEKKQGKLIFFLLPLNRANLWLDFSEIIAKHEDEECSTKWYI